MKTLETQMAAVLHDVIEDCGVKPALLAHEGFPASVIEANMDLPRIAQPNEKDLRRIEKYKAAKRVIEKAIAEAG